MLNKYCIAADNVFPLLMMDVAVKSESGAKQKMNGRPSVYKFAGYSLNLGDQTLLGKVEAQPLPAKIFHFLRLLCKYKIDNRILDKEDLVAQVWQGRFVSDEAIARVVASARKLLGDSAKEQLLIETVRKRGYRLAVEVDVVGSPAISQNSPVESLVSSVEILELAAVINEPFCLDMLQALNSGAAEKDAAEEMVDKLDRLIEDQYLITDSLGQSYEFIDQAQRSAIYDSLSLSVRQRYHRLVALQLLERPLLHRDYGQVQYHLQRCKGLVNDRFVLDSMTAAAEQLLSNYEYQAAAELIEKSLGYTDNEVDYHFQKLFLAEALIRSGSIGPTREMLLEVARFARLNKHWELLARAACAYNNEQEDARVDEAALQMLQWAVASAPADPSHLTVKVFARLAEALYTSADFDAVHAYDKRAMADARKLRNPKVLGGALKCHFYSTYVAGNLDYKQSIVNELQEIGLAEDDDGLLHNSYVYSVANALESGERGGIDQAIASYEQLVQRSQNTLFQLHLGYQKVLQLLLAGDIKAAEQQLDDYFQRGIETGHSLVMTSYSIQLYGLRLAQGRLDELRSVMVEMARDYPLTPWGLASACLEVNHGNLDPGNHLLQRFYESSEQLLTNDINLLAKLAFLAQLSVLLAARDKMHWIYQELQKYSDLHVMVGLGILHLGSVEYFLGWLAEEMQELKLAERHYEIAQQKELSLGAYGALANTRFRLACCLRKDKRAGNRSLEILQQSINTSKILGMRDLNLQAEEELRCYYPGKKASKLVLVSSLD